MHCAYPVRDGIHIAAADVAEPRNVKLLKQHLFWKEVSPWSTSALKRVFDCLCVLVATPLIVPILLLVAFAVRITSRGPVMFVQERVGRDGRVFTIFKFRTMTHHADIAHDPITTSKSQQFTSIGPLLRRWKLDELPQMANVLLGHMSLVGPRPKLPEHMISNIPCRPGLTGMATIVFASEETVLARIPVEHLNAYYQDVVLPAKRQLDIDYMARATLGSDLGLLFHSVLHWWDDLAMERILLDSEADDESDRSAFCELPPPRMTSPSARAEHLEFID